MPVSKQLLNQISISSAEPSMMDSDSMGEEIPEIFVVDATVGLAVGVALDLGFLDDAL